MPQRFKKYAYNLMSYLYSFYKKKSVIDKTQLKNKNKREKRKKMKVIFYH